MPVQARAKCPVVIIGIVEIQRKEKAPWGRLIRTDFGEEMGIERGLKG